MIVCDIQSKKEISAIKKWIIAIKMLQNILQNAIK